MSKPASDDYTIFGKKGCYEVINMNNSISRYLHRVGKMRCR